MQWLIARSTGAKAGSLRFWRRRGLLGRFSQSLRQTQPVAIDADSSNANQIIIRHSTEYIVRAQNTTKARKNAAIPATRAHMITRLSLIAPISTSCTQSTSFRPSTTAFSTASSTRAPSPSPRNDGGTSTDRKICFLNRRANYIQLHRACRPEGMTTGGTSTSTSTIGAQSATEHPKRANRVPPSRCAIDSATSELEARNSEVAAGGMDVLTRR